MAKTRAFLAIPLPQRLVDDLARAQKRLAGDFPSVRWGRPETLHLTLRFFGDCDQETLDKIAEAMVSVGVQKRPFRLQVSGLGAFPTADRPRVFWLGLHDHGRLLELYDDLEAQLETAGIPKEGRRFAPHLTLGRARQRIFGAQKALERNRDLDCGELPVKQLILYSSELRPQGALHLPLHSVDLGGKEG